jgi:hypothetical protein
MYTATTKTLPIDSRPPPEPVANGLTAPSASDA